MGTTTERHAGRRARVGAFLALLVAALLLTACGGPVSDPEGGSATPSPSTIGDEPVRTPDPAADPAPTPTPTHVPTPTPSPPADRACPAAPGASTGPAATIASVRLTVPRSAASAAVVPASARIVVHADAPRVVLDPASSGLAVLRGGTLVGWAGSPGTSPVPLPLTGGTTRPAQVLPETLALVACDGSPLPAGEYAVQAVVGYGGDALNAGVGGVPRVFQLASEPAQLTIT